jgi:hypothetical protein
VKPLLLAILLSPLLGAAQPATALLLKKNTKTIQRFYPGRPITFTTTEGMPVNGMLDSLVRDSLYLTYSQVVRVPNRFGGQSIDTAGRYQLAFSVANVGSFPRRRSGLLPGALVLGGLGYTAVNVVNTLREGDALFGKDNLGNLLGGLGAAGAGLLIGALRENSYRIGKKYQLVIMR